MFKLASSHQSGREKFKSMRAIRQRKALVWKAIRDSKNAAAKKEPEHGPPMVLAAA